MQAALQTVEISDSIGRQIVLRKPAVLAQFRIVEAVGAESAANTTYMSMVMPLIYVASIDGEPVVLPKKKSEIEALIQRLSDEGLDAVYNVVQKTWGKSDPEADAIAIKK